MSSFGAREAGSLTFDRLSTVARVIGRCGTSSGLPHLRQRRALSRNAGEASLREAGYSAVCTNGPYFSSKGQASAALRDGVDPGQWDMRDRNEYARILAGGNGAASPTSARAHPPCVLRSLTPVWTSRSGSCKRITRTNVLSPTTQTFKARETL